MAIFLNPPKVSVTGVFCDFWSFTVHVPSPAQRKAILARLTPAGMDAMGYMARYNGRQQYRQGVRVRVEPQSEETVRLNCDPWNEGAAFLRAEFNPAKVSLPDAKMLLERVLDQPWAAILATARVTRFDAAVNVAHIKIEDLLLSVPKISISQTYNKGGRTQSYYLGCADGDRQIKFYDKVAEIKKKNQKKMLKDPMPAHPLTRIEVRLSPDITFAGLAGISNPFQSIRVQHYGLLPPGGDQVFRLFKEVAQVKGAQHALALLDPPYREQMDKVLASAACGWWKPQAIWCDWPHVLAQLVAPPPPYAVIADAEAMLAPGHQLAA